MVKRIGMVGLIGALLCLLLTVGPTSPAAAALPNPAGLRSVSQSATALSLTWKSVSGAQGYRVYWGESSTLAKASSTVVQTTTAELTGLSPSTTYYARVRALGANSAAGAPSAIIRTATVPKSSYSLLAPAGLKVTARGSTSASFGWKSRDEGVRYQIQYGPSSTFEGARSATTAGLSVRVMDLKAGTTTYVRVRGLTAKGAAASQYSPPVKFATQPYRHARISGLRASDAATTAVALTWTAKSGATRYRIRYSRSAKMLDPIVRYSTTNRIELSSLLSGTTYYVQARVVADDLDALSAYSSVARVTTAKSTGYTSLAPTGLTLTDVGSSTVTLNWASRGAGLIYQVRLSSGGSFATAATVSTHSATLSKLTPLTRYRIVVRVASSAGRAQSADSTALSLTTELAGKALVRVASYNVRCHYCSDTPAANEHPWTLRRSAVVNTIRAQHPDVVGLQEASQTRLIGADGKALKDSQFDDLVKRLGAPYKITNPYRYNCVNGYSSSKCKAKARGASKGTKIVYNSSTLTLGTTGTVRLTSPKGKYRYAVWAIFTDRATKKSFFFVNTHLEYEKDVAGSTYFYDLRVAQTNDLVALIRAKSRGLPIVVTGDFNTSKKTVPNNAPYDILTAAGLVDPLGNTYQSTKPAASATVQKRIRTNYNSYNGFALDPPKSGNINGTYVDYIFTSPKVAVPEWETVLNLNAQGRMDGVIGSDHNMIRATIELP